MTGADVSALDTALRTMSGGGVVYGGAILIPGDEAVLFCFDATDANAVAIAGASVGLRCDRVVPATFLDLRS